MVRIIDTWLTDDKTQAIAEYVQEYVNEEMDVGGILSQATDHILAYPPKYGERPNAFY